MTSAISTNLLALEVPHDVIGGRDRHSVLVLVAVVVRNKRLDFSVTVEVSPVHQPLRLGRLRKNSIASGTGRKSGE